MPKCKNDPSRSYKGDEPSPKGLGYCAHAEKEGKIMEGKDGNKWIIKKLENGSKRWVKYSINKDLKEKNEEYQKIKAKFKGYKKYKTLWNGARPYLCYIKGNEVYIFKQDPGKNIQIPKEYPFDRDWMYTKFVKKYKTDKIFIGKDKGTNPGSDLYPGINKRAIKESLGNTILLKLKNNKYVFIGYGINEFTTKENIIKYYSLVGPNDTPYPISLGKDNVYFMLDDFYIPRDYFSKLKKDKDFEDAYGSLYQMKREEQEKIKKDFKNYKRIDMAS